MLHCTWSDRPFHFNDDRWPHAYRSTDGDIWGVARRRYDGTWEGRYWTTIDATADEYLSAGPFESLDEAKATITALVTLGE